MRRRTTRPEVPAVHPGGLARASVSFVSVPTTPLLQLEAAVPPLDGVRGAIVKVSPTLRASEREGFHGAQVAARLRGAGARAVQLAPVIIPEVGAPRVQGQAVRAKYPAEAVRSHFEELRGVSEADRLAGMELAMQLVEQAQGGSER